MYPESQLGRDVCNLQPSNGSPGLHFDNYFMYTHKHMQTHNHNIIHWRQMLMGLLNMHA